MLSENNTKNKSIKGLYASILAEWAKLSIKNIMTELFAVLFSIDIVICKEIKTNIFTEMMMSIENRTAHALIKILRAVPRFCL